MIAQLTTHWRVPSIRKDVREDLLVADHVPDSSLAADTRETRPAKGLSDAHKLLGGSGKAAVSRMLLSDELGRSRYIGLG